MAGVGSEKARLPDDDQDAPVQYVPICASKRACFVNQEGGENLEVENVWLPSHGEFDPSLLRGPKMRRASESKIKYEFLPSI